VNALNPSRLHNLPLVVPLMYGLHFTTGVHPQEHHPNRNRRNTMDDISAVAKKSITRSSKLMIALPPGGGPLIGLATSSQIEMDGIREIGIGRYRGGLERNRPRRIYLMRARGALKGR
jgi:hypothetical protein